MVRAVAAVSVLLVGVMGCSRHQPNSVAEVSGERITEEQFTERYRGYLSSTSQRDNILLRQQILNNMINEVLIYKDMARRGLDRDETYHMRMEELLTQTLLTSYARKIVVDTSSIPEEDLYKEFHAYNSKVTARFLYAGSEAGARELKSRVEHGTTFEELAKEVFEDPGLANNGGSLGTFGWGEMEPALEEVAFSEPVGAISEPVRLSMGYALVKVENRSENRFVTEGDYLKVREKLWRAVLDRKFSRLMKRELNRIEKDISPSFNERAIDELFKNWQFFSGNASSASLGAETTNSPPDMTSMELVRFKTGIWTVGGFIKRVMKTTERQRMRVRVAGDVKSMAIGLATREVLLEKAKELGLGSDSTAVEALHHAREAFLLKRWLAAVTDGAGESSLDEEALKKRYEEKNSEYAYPPEVNVAEILLRTEAEGTRIMAQLQKGADFAELARKNSIRLWAAKRNGELGFGGEAQFGQMGRKFFAANIGDIVGPEKVDPYFGIFKILEKRAGRTMTFDEARERIIGEQKQARLIEARKNALEHLRQGVSISINNDLLANIVVN